MIRSLLRKLLFKWNDGRILINHELIKVHPKLGEYYNVRQNNPIETELYGFLSKLLRPGDVFIDVGANAGFFSLLASKRCGENGKVIAFEPNPVVVNYANYTLTHNADYRNYIVLQQAVSDNTDLLPISIADSDSPLMERASLVHKEAKSKEVEVLCTTLDGVIPSALKPSVIKVDVEGAELGVLKGASAILEKHKPIICVEMHGLYFDDPAVHTRSVFSFFQSMGYVPVNLLKKKIETVEQFMSDSGTTEYNKSGYGNLILVPNAELVSKIIQLL